MTGRRAGVEAIPVKAAKKRQRQSRSAAHSLQESALERLREDIISGVLRQGEAINEAKLCERYDIGRTPVHQAIAKLQAQGLVEVIPRKGTLVRAISFDEVIQLAEARLINEMEVARLAANRITPDEIAKLESLVIAMEVAHEQRDPKQTMALDREFHATIHQAARNPILAEFLRSVYDRSMRVWYMSLGQRDYFDGLQVEHRALVDALRKGDADLASAAMRDHIMSYRNNLRRQI